MDLTTAVAAAVYAALGTGVTLAPVFGAVPDDTLPPFVVVGDDSVDPTVGGKTDRIERHELTVLTLFAGQSKRAMLACADEVRAALDGVALAAEGASLSPPVVLSFDDRVDAQTGVFVGEHRFLIFATPA